MIRSLGFLALVAACGSTPSHPGDDTSPDPDAPIADALAVQPAAYTVPIGRAQIFVAAGATSWSVVEGAAGGTVGGDGTYTAPTTPGTYHVQASDGTHTGVATVTVADFRLGLLAGVLGGPGEVDDVGALARLDQPYDIVTDGAGLYYFVDDHSNSVRRLVGATGAVTTVAGRAGNTSTTDGIGVDAGLGYPRGLAIDRAHGILYLTSTSPPVVRKLVLATGEVTTIAGGTYGTSDGLGTLAQFASPAGIAFDGANTLWIADSGSCTIRRLAIDSRMVTTAYGTPGVCSGLDGAGAATFAYPQSILYVPSSTSGLERVFVTDQYAVRMISALGGVQTIAGSATSGYADQPGAAATFNALTGITTDGTGTLYVIDHNNCAVRTVQIAAPHAVATLAGGTGGWADGTGTAAKMQFPQGITWDGTALWVTDAGNSAIRAVETTGKVTTIAGKPPHRGSTHGDFTTSTFQAPTGLALDGTSTLYTTESSEVRALALAAQQTTALAGGPALGRADGTGAAAKLHLPNGIVLDRAAGYAYVADTANHAIRRIAFVGGVVDTPFDDIATATPGFHDDTGTLSRFDGPSGLVLVGSTLYVADTNNDAIRAIDLPTGKTTTFAGGTTGDQDGIGTAAQFHDPGALATDGTHLFVSDTSNWTIRQIDLATAEVTTIAGSGHGTGYDDGLGRAASFAGIAALAYDGAGTLYIADARAQLLRRLYLPTGAVSTLAGRPFRGGVHMDSVPGAQLGTPTALALGAPGTIYLTANAENAILALVQQ